MRVGGGGGGGSGGEGTLTTGPRTTNQRDEVRQGERKHTLPQWRAGQHRASGATGGRRRRTSTPHTRCRHGALQSFGPGPRLGSRETEHQAATAHCTTAAMSEAATCGPGEQRRAAVSAAATTRAAVTSRRLCSRACPPSLGCTMGPDDLVFGSDQWASEGWSLSRGSLHYSSDKPRIFYSQITVGIQWIELAIINSSDRCVPRFGSEKADVPSRPSCLSIAGKAVSDLHLSPLCAVLLSPSCLLFVVCSVFWTTLRLLLRSASVVDRYVSRHVPALPFPVPST